MSWFTKEALVAWRNNIPDDIVVCIDDITDEGQAAADFIAKLLPNIKTSDDYVSVVRDNQEKFIEMGRARRLRFLAWCNARLYREKENRIKVNIALTEVGSGDEEGSAGNGGAGPYFLEDIKAFAEAIGPRAAAIIVDENTLKTIAGVGMQMENDRKMNGGGR